MIKIYHNPRCTKSRQGVAYLEEKGLEFDIVKYLDTPLSREELVEVLNQLDIAPLDLIRKTEAIWKSEFKGKQLSDDEIIDAMITYPKLMERPIIVKDNKAVIARPTENIDQIL